jgi:CRP-like cAMP-binding protein
MISHKPPARWADSLVRNLAAYTSLRTDDHGEIHAALGEVRTHAANVEFAPSRAGREFGVASGWLAEAVCLEDGRRQLVGLFLPGDLISFDLLRPKGAVVVALTTARSVAITPERSAGPPEGRRPLWFLQALAGARRDRELQQGRQIVRLGRMSAYERMADFLVELHARQLRAGLTDGGGIEFPITQEVLADHLGLSIVHVNRTLQQLRRDGLIESRSGRVILPDLRALTAVAGIPAEVAPRLGARSPSEGSVVRLGEPGEHGARTSASPVGEVRRSQPLR